MPSSPNCEHCFWWYDPENSLFSARTITARTSASSFMLFMLCWCYLRNNTNITITCLLEEKWNINFLSGVVLQCCSLSSFFWLPGRQDTPAKSTGITKAWSWLSWCPASRGKIQFRNCLILRGRLLSPCANPTHICHRFICWHPSQHQQLCFVFFCISFL